ncbi:unnamed protein product, partial [Prunus brigantina]
QKGLIKSDFSLSLSASGSHDTPRGYCSPTANFGHCRRHGAPPATRLAGSEPPPPQQPFPTISDVSHHRNLPEKAVKSRRFFTVFRGIGSPSSGHGFRRVRVLGVL